MRAFEILCELINQFNPYVHLEYLPHESKPGEHRVAYTNIAYHSTITYSFRTVEEFVEWLDTDDDCTAI